MNAALDATLRNLNDCGCCEGLSADTPVQVYNRPGLTAIAYRVGTHDQFKQTLLARLSASGQAALRALNTRDDDDFSIALLDAWATVADVLTFYQERIANESYLRTARERLSVLELVRLIDYELRPGVAASTYLAFTLEETPGAFGQALSLGTTAQSAPEPLPPITIDIGTKVQSIPGPGEQAQTFETIEKIEARAEWSAIKPRLTQPQTLSLNVGSIMLQGTATNLKPGDTVLIAVSASSRVEPSAFWTSPPMKMTRQRALISTTPRFRHQCIPDHCCQRAVLAIFQPRFRWTRASSKTSSPGNGVKKICRRSSRCRTGRSGSLWLTSPSRRRSACLQRAPASSPCASAPPSLAITRRSGSRCLLIYVLVKEYQYTKVMGLGRNSKSFHLLSHRRGKPAR